MVSEVNIRPTNDGIFDRICLAYFTFLKSRNILFVDISQTNHCNADSGSAQGMPVENSGRASSASSEKSEKSPKRTIAGKTVESWEDAADNSTSTGRGTPATTPEDEDTSIDTDGNGHHVPASKPRTKIKPKAEEATTTEKEHVNVVFIGHVGKL